MELFDAIYTRRSVRKYLDKPVSRKVLETLLNTAVQAPSAMNSQPWAYLVIQDKDRLIDLSNKSKQQLLATMESEPRIARYRTLLSNPSFNIFYDAPALVVILAKPTSLHPNEDCCLAAQNLMLAAHDLELGSCWIGFSLAALACPEVKKTLSIPEEYQAIAPIVIGYPETPAPSITKIPLKLSAGWISQYD